MQSLPRHSGAPPSGEPGIHIHHAVVMDSRFLAVLGPNMESSTRKQKNTKTPEGASRCRAVASGLMDRSAAINCSL
jgi:hypothetical protein